MLIFIVISFTFRNVFTCFSSTFRTGFKVFSLLIQLKFTAVLPEHVTIKSDIFALDKL